MIYANGRALLKAYIKQTLPVEHILFFKPPLKYLTLIVCVCVSVRIHGHSDTLSILKFLKYPDLGDV